MYIDNVTEENDYSHKLNDKPGEVHCDVDPHVAVGHKLVVKPLNVGRTDVPGGARRTVKVTLVDVFLVIHANKCLPRLTHTNNEEAHYVLPVFWMTSFFSIMGHMVGFIGGKTLDQQP